MRLHSFSLILAAASMCFVVGCEDKKPTPAASSTSAKVQPASPALSIPKLPPRKFARHDRMGRQRPKGAMGMLLGAAMKAPDLTEEQKGKLEALQPKPGEKPRDAKATKPDREGYHKAWLEAVKSGKVDEKAFDEHTKAMQKEREERKAEQAKHLNELHAILTPPQRKAVADSVRERLEKRGNDAKAKGDEAKDGDEAKAKGGETKGPKHRPDDRLRMKKMDHPSPGLRLVDRIRNKSRHKHPGFGFERMSAGLKLTDEQNKKVEELAKKVKEDRPDEKAREERREAAKKNMAALLAAFEKDTFDATKLELEPKGDEMGAWMKKQLAHFSEFLAILTEEQRTELAKRFEARRVQFPEAPTTSELDDLSDELGAGSTAKPTKTEETDDKGATPAKKAAEEPTKAPAK